MDVYIRPMTTDDVPQVLRLEADAFPEDPATDFDKELANRLACYLVACYKEQNSPQGAEHIVGYCGTWLVIDESHLLSIAVTREHRRKGVGELLLIAVLEDVIARGAQSMFLEVRVSNSSARALYEKYGFVRLGVRRGYYRDNNEDAVVMRAEGLGQSSYKETLAVRKGQVRDKYHG